jgi:urate oxidase
MSSELTASRYGKDKIRVFRVVREANMQHIVEYNVTSLLEGDVGASYTEADNSVVVTTDSSVYHHLLSGYD